VEIINKTKTRRKREKKKQTNKQNKQSKANKQTNKQTENKNIYINKQAQAKKQLITTHSQKYEDLYWDKMNNTYHTIDKDELTLCVL